MSEDPQPDASTDVPFSPDEPASPDVGQNAELAQKTQVTRIVATRLADQARRTSEGVKARRLTSTDSQPGVTDLTPLRELLAELVEEARKLRTRERIAQALRQAADAIDPPVRPS